MLKSYLNHLLLIISSLTLVACDESTMKTTRTQPSERLVFDGFTVKEICDAARSGREAFGYAKEPMSEKNIRMALVQRYYQTGTCAQYYYEQQLTGEEPANAIIQRIKRIPN